MKYKVGDIVTVKTKKQLLESGWERKNHDLISSKGLMNDEMLLFCGKKVTIKKYCYFNNYDYIIINSKWYWNDEMFVDKEENVQLEFNF